MLVADSLTAGYAPKRPVLHEVSITVEPGRLVALLGANGAGKTTTLRAVIGALPFVEGTITLDGADSRGWGPARLVRAGVAMVPEGRGILGGLSVRENLRMGGYLVRPRSAVADRIEEALVLFPKLRERLKLSGSMLSGGEQQMLALARALVSKPRYLLLDEPSMGLAPILVETLLTVFRKLADGGMGVLLVEQNARAALSVADSAHVLERGRVVLAGPASTVDKDSLIQDAYLGVGR